MRLRTEPLAAWVIDPSPEPPITDVIDACRAGGALDLLDELGGTPLGRQVVLRPARSHREYALTVRLIRPRLLWALLRSRADVVVVQELNLIAACAVVSKLVRRRAVVALIEGDLMAHVGVSGSAAWKMTFRRLVARFVDVFAANGPEAMRYLTAHLRVPREAVREGWWLAGHGDPGSRTPDSPAGARSANGATEGLTFLTASRLLPPKGIDLLVKAFADAHAGGPHRLIVAGDGPERGALEALVQRRALTDQVTFVGMVDRGHLAALMAASDVFVFPTLQDLVGRVAVEALSLATPVIASSHAGAAGTVVRHGVNGLVVDPQDPGALCDALLQVVDPQLLASLRAGAAAGRADLTPQAAGSFVLDAIAHARDRATVRQGQRPTRAFRRVLTEAAARRR